MELPRCEQREALSDVFREVDWLKSSCACLKPLQFSAKMEAN